MILKENYFKISSNNIFKILMRITYLEYYFLFCNVETVAAVVVVKRVKSL